MKKRKWKHPAPLICFIKKITQKESDPKLTFGTACDYKQKSCTQCGDCKHNVRQRQWEAENDT